MSGTTDNGGIGAGGIAGGTGVAFIYHHSTKVKSREP